MSALKNLVAINTYNLAGIFISIGTTISYTTLGHFAINNQQYPYKSKCLGTMGFAELMSQSQRCSLNSFVV
jgi:hypothetical protein